MITFHRRTSDGTGTLAHAITIAIYDYQRAFDHEPKRITVPYFRCKEMDTRLLTDWNTKDGPRFRGITFRFTLMSSAIELHGTFP